MTKPQWRGTSPYETRKPIRDLLRQHLPATGVVITDLDLIIRHYTPDTERFRLIEVKHQHAPITNGQSKTFRLMHNLLRTSDPNADTYDGIYLVNEHDSEWGDGAKVRVRRLYEHHADETMDTDTFIAWLTYQHEVAII